VCHQGMMNAFCVSWWRPVRAAIRVDVRLFVRRCVSPRLSEVEQSAVVTLKLRKSGFLVQNLPSDLSHRFHGFAILSIFRS